MSEFTIGMLVGGAIAYTTIVVCDIINRRRYRV